jgi:UDP-N-acetylglucosamine diphosphorylase / glucose-1-phosphate thymidylyltransferase / UDP-N-acetylgalactosamine diphosphorylase / glucosamine-1-phosphate N-acetyltransferase / galactosamine-1-phosphate N-acetyltransferase
MNLAIFDDYPELFLPVSLTRSVGDIRCGILKLRQRLQALLFGEEEAVILDESLVSLYRERHPAWIINSVSGDTLFVNSRLKISPEGLAVINKLQKGQSLKDQSGHCIALRKDVTDPDFNPEKIKSLVDRAEVQILPDLLYQNMADLIMDNARLIEYDFDQFFHDAENFIETEPGVTILNPYRVWIGEGAILKPGVVVDASHGAVVIDEKAEVMSHAVILGPAYIGKGSIIKIGSKIYGGTSVGPVCKIGGEVEGSIIQAFTNKQHDGFLGHAYLGEWVNLGAGTSNSDLKNNYKSVAFHSYAENGKIQSGYQFLGSILADHVKTGINCSLNTGVVMGAGSNIWGKDLISGHIPSFSWGEAGQLEPYNFEAFIETARTVKQRRNLTLSEIEVNLYRDIRKQMQQEK